MKTALGDGAPGMARRTIPIANALRHLRRAWGSSVPALLLLLVVVAAWWSAARWSGVSAVLLPGPDLVVSEYLRLSDYLAAQAWVTLIETAVGFILAVLAGFIIGTAIATVRILERAVMPWMVALNGVPKVAFAPVLVVWLGFGMEPKIAMVILMCFFPVLLATATGLRSAPADMVELGRSLDASRWQIFRKIRLPGAMPQVFVGLKIAMPLAVIGAVIGEFAAGSAGLGYVVAQSGATGNTALAFAAIIILSIMSITLFYALVVGERLLLPWVRNTTS